MAPLLEARKNRSESHIRQDFFTFGDEEMKSAVRRVDPSESLTMLTTKDQNAALRLSCQ
jgi:hypothetical protein